MKKYSKSEIGALCDAFNRSPVTVGRWIEAKDDRLTSKKAVTALAKLKNRGKLFFQKDHVYTIDHRKHLCILVDDSLACLCPIQPHKKDTGYNIKLAIACIYSAEIANNSIPITEVGRVENGNFILL